MRSFQKWNTLLFGAVFLLALSPLPVSALRLSEIMYNPEGADTHREWIEVYNDEGGSVDIGSWYLHENDTFHALHPDGFQSLPSGEYAIITTNPAQARQELGSSLRYVKASFSLKNTGERIELADSGKTIRDTVDYTPEMGADGNGKSLQLIHGTWQEADPTPGRKNEENDSSNGGSPEESEGEEDSDSTSSEEVQAKTVPSKPRFHVRFRIVPSSALEGELVRFEQEVFKNEGREVDGVFVLNFGDGTEIRKSQWVERHYHRYIHPGKYLVTFNYYEDWFAFREDRDPTLSVQRVIEVLPRTKVSIEAVNPYDGVVLKNGTSENIHLARWELEWSGKRFVFPSASYLPANGILRVSYNTLRFRPDLSRGGKVILRSDTGYALDFYPHLLEESSSGKTKKGKRVSRKGKEKENQTQKRESTGREEVYSFQELPNHNQGREMNPFESYLQKHPGKRIASFSEIPQKEGGRDSGVWKLISLGLSFLLVLVSVRSFIYRIQKEKRKDNSSNEEEVDLFEDIQLLED